MRVIIVSISLFFCGVASASTITIDFEALPIGGTPIGGDFVEVIDQGFSFISEAGVQEYGDGGKAIVGFSSGIDFDTGEISISRLDGAAFALYSADISLASFYIAWSDQGNFDSSTGPGLDELGTGAWLNINSVLFFGDSPPFAPVAIDNIVVGSAVPIPAVVDIDVDPWSAINIIKPNLDLPIFAAVLGSSEFDVMQIDPATVKLGESTTTTPAPWFSDVDNDTDGNIDAVFGFATQDTGIACNDTEVTLTGETFGGAQFEGTDTIDATDCVSARCHPL